MVEYDGCIIEPRGRVYIDVQGPSWSARQDTRSISILDVSYRMYTLTPPRSHSGSVVNNMNDVDGQTGDKQK
jgi:hypothetical protein